MKNLLSLLLILVFAISCASHKNQIKFSETTPSQENDSTQYELVVFDPNFETWYTLKDNPAMYHSQSYYEVWNRQYVLAWNLHAMDFRANKFFETIVGYEFDVDYGFQLNHKLFHYFMYVEHVLKIPILENGPHFSMI